MRFLISIAILFATSQASAFSYATGGCAADGCAEGEQWLHTNANEIDTALDTIESDITTLESAMTTAESDITTLQSAVASAGTVTGIGNCSSGSCFATGGNGTLLQSDTDFEIEIDANNNGSNVLNILGGNGSLSAEFTETGGFTATSSVAAGFPSVTLGSFIYYNSSNSNTTTIQSGTPAGNITFTLPSNDGDADQQLTTNGSGVLSWAAAGGSSGVMVDQGNNVTPPASHGLIVGSANDNDTCEAGETCIDEGAVIADSFTARATATPTVGFDDSQTTVETSDASIVAQATDEGTGTEDVDLTISVQVASTLTPRITIDADGSTTIPSLASTNAVLTTPNIGAATGTSLDLGTGTIRGGVCTEYATAATIASGFAAGDMEGCWYFITSGTDTIVLPAITADGQSACFYAVGANVITLDPNASDQIRRSDGTLQTAGVTITSPATAGSFGCFISANSSGTDDEWILLGANGTWAVGS